MNKLILLAAALIALPSCLQTRGDIAHTPNPVQQKAAVESSKFDEVNKDFRELYGKVEALEHQVDKYKDAEKVKSLEAKIAQLENKLHLMETSVTELYGKAKKEAMLAEMKDKEEQLKKDKEAADAKKSPLGEANRLYENNKWEDAILSFEEYRKKHPKGKQFAEATFKIGVCFQQLGMKDDAKAFFKEVVDKYPKSAEATQAKTKLKKL